MRHHLSLHTYSVFTDTGYQYVRGAWILEGQVWNSPYTDTQVYFSQLSIELAPHEHVQTFVSLPIQYTSGQETGDLTLQYPRLALAWSVPWDDVVSSTIRLEYQLKPQQVQLQGGVQMLSDPIALNCALSWQKQTFALEGSLVFAVNERWALGAHLHYAKNALLRYEIHHTSKGGKQRQVSYSHSVDGSLQCLGLKIVF